MAKRAAKTASPWRNRIVAQEVMDPHTLEPSPWNWRTHPRLQKDALTGALNDLGWIQQIVVNRQSGHLIDGHLRLALALERGEPAVPVLYVALDEAEEKLALLTLDPVAAMADANREQLATLLHEVSSGEAGVQQLLAQLAEEQGIVPAGVGMNGAEADVEPQVDRAEELRQQWGVEGGQLWQCGNHRVLCGDCTDKAVVERLMQGEQADILINDPPYGMRLDTDFSSMRSHLDFAREKGVLSGRRYKPVIGDGHAYDAGPVRSLFAEVPEQFWFGADFYAATLGDTMQTGAWLVWDKRLEEAADRMYGSCFELVWSQQKHKRDILRHKWAGIFGTEHEPQRGRMHPTQKPVALYADLLTRYSEEGLRVVDCYLGSGTTLIACEHLQRRCYGCELDPGYVAVTLERYRQATGTLPVLLS